MSAVAVDQRPTRPPFPRGTVAGYDGPRDLDGRLELSRELAQAVRTIPALYREKPADILATLYQAMALDIPVMTALQSLHWDVDSGKGALSAQLMAALLLRGGVTWTIDDSPGRRVEMTFSRNGRPVGACSWSIADALRAGIANRENWIKFPDDNLYARCLSRGARWFAADLILGLGYTIEELQDMRAGVDQPTDRDSPDEPVDARVTDFLAAIDGSTPASRIQEMMAQAQSKKVGLAGEYAGAGMTVLECLQDAWRVAAAREAAQKNAAVAPDSPAGAGTSTASAIAEKPAGAGVFDCGCPAAEVINTGTHREGCDDGRTDNDS